VLDHDSIARGLDSVPAGIDVLLLPYDAPFQPRNESEVVAAMRTYAFGNAQQARPAPNQRPDPNATCAQPKRTPDATQPAPR
jgi:hypothetical protein